MRFIATACPGEYGPKVVIDRRWREELAQPGVELLGRLAGDRVVVGDRAALLDDLARRVQADDALEARAGEPLPTSATCSSNELMVGS